MKTDRPILFSAWQKLVQAYLVTFIVGLVAGLFFVQVLNVQPERLFELSSKRLSYALPVFEGAMTQGIDMGVLLFVWNTTGALITLSFVYTASWFNPGRTHKAPRLLRSIFCGRSRMRLLCYLPGCAKIEAEALRRLYVWLMVPLLGIMLLGLESGLQVATATFLFDSFFSSFMALLPHGVIEIPALALAGAVPYSANLLVRRKAQTDQTDIIFRQMEAFRKKLPILKIAMLVTVGLLFAGVIEAHITPLFHVYP